jgi:aldose 1-epimerase
LDGGPIPQHGSFLMAPWVAELHLGRLAFRGETHQLPANVGRHAVHGLVMNGAWVVESRSATRVALVRELVDPWPFGGHVRHEIRLDDRGVTQIAIVVAAARAMPVSIGWHPWFRCESPNRSRVRVEATGRLDLDDELIPTGRVLALSGDVDLREAPTFGERRIDVVYVGAASPVEYLQPGLRLSMAFDPAISVVVVYSTAGTICIEPWSVWPDAVRMAGLGFPSGVVELESGETLARWTRWTWEHTTIA